ncbi:hypothetical protein BX616_005933 [Lobosporangium transversale]|uniref:precorrin-2 dehydrogenase n=1 Tax=Lobosporangium transversale TaxID=64571 RepID=A0A1Y2GT17_9FUNG|nr:tetrapyrrole methylase [Lobosporangium transversale]KAF9915536.1 hypothetical protein BX616_005933 [Lobosporangium transversale]ORZ20128.1 tetrapyrrole methylase [Lobosporangium transversale]|eukprot:XP_021882668.1 tetrapyrrole methylase [Lobosporangium transversale]
MVRSAIDPIRPGASLILAWQIKHKHVVIIGGGFVAAGRLVNVLEADARVTLICPENEELSETVRQHLQDHPETTRLVDRPFQDSDLTTRFGEHTTTVATVTATTQNQHSIDTDNNLNGDLEPAVDMVLSAIDDIPLSTHIYHLAKRLRIPVNIADVPPQCDFYFCSTHRDKALQVAVSTSGKGPKLANLVRRHIADHLPYRVGDAIEQVGVLRAKLRKMAPGPEVGPKRMQWMSRVCEQWKMEDLAELEEKSMQVILSGFRDDKVYSYDEVLQKLRLLESSSLSLADRKIDVTAAFVEQKQEQEEHKHNVSAQSQSGRLILVGAGPGDPELLTRKAVRLLEEAELVVADRLIPLDVLDLARGEVRIAPKKRTILAIEQEKREQIPTGYDSSDSSVSSVSTVCSDSDQDSVLPKSRSSDYIQDQLNEWCLQGLREGKTVVRLKQGDPFIFGRGAEEILFFREKGFEAEVVPGISSALSAPLTANIPLTHRGSADQVVITTAQAKGGVLPDNFPTYDSKRTVVILMGVGKAKEISDLMQSPKLSWPANIPVVVVENAHCPEERVMDATLSTLAQVVEEQKAVPPAVFVIGWAGSVLRKAL